jgi:hypothetical protein
MILVVPKFFWKPKKVEALLRNLKRFIKRGRRDCGLNYRPQVGKKEGPRCAVRSIGRLLQFVTGVDWV